MVDQFVAGAVMFLLVDAAVGRVVEITSWLTLLVPVVFGAVAYFGVLLAVSPHFRETLQYTVLDGTPLGN
jgi:hypothetical protein